MAQEILEKNIQVVMAKSVYVTSADYCGQVEGVFISTGSRSTIYVASENDRGFDEIKIIIVDKDAYVTIVDEEDTILERWFNIVNYWIKTKRGSS
jgi:hypothetical protein